MREVACGEKPFRVERLSLVNYRRFSDLKFVPSGFNVIVGINGSGKTTLLQAMTEIFYLVAERIVSGRYGWLTLNSSDVRLGADTAFITAEVLSSDQRFSQRLLVDKLSQSPNANGISEELEGIIRDTAPEGASLYALADRYRENLVADGFASLPILTCYPINRIELNIPVRTENQQAIGQSAAYDGAFENRRDFRSFFNWFRERQDAENDQRLDKTEYRDTQLEAVRRATEVLMDGYRDLRVRHAPLRMTLKKEGEELTTDQLSGGEKALLALVGDLARRMAIANPGLKNPLEGEGVVMIDEVDLHLHPSWQRKVVQRLPETFPNVQFFLTTHSPVVASAVRPESLWVLRDGEIKHAEAYGQDVGLVLSEVFDTPPRLEEVRRELDALFLAIHRQDLGNAEARLKGLEDEIGPSDPELVQARVMMQGYAAA